MKNFTKTLLAIGFTSALALTTALSQPFPNAVLSVNEQGPALLLGTNIAGFINGAPGLDPVSGLVTLAYPIPWAAAPGDILLREPPGTTNSDLIRFGNFQGTNYLYFFSELEPSEPNPDPADGPVIPPAFNPIILQELGPEGNNGALYTPLPGQPGFDTSGLLPGLTYNFISDVPEPGSLALLLSGAAILGLRMLRRKNRA